MFHQEVETIFSPLKRVTCLHEQNVVKAIHYCRGYIIKFNISPPGVLILSLILSLPHSSVLSLSPLTLIIQTSCCKESQATSEPSTLQPSCQTLVQATISSHLNNFSRPSMSLAKLHFFPSLVHPSCSFQRSPLKYKSPPCLNSDRYMMDR